MDLCGPACRAMCCGDIIQSRHRHDWVPCKCGESFVDGGSDYTRWGGNVTILTSHMDLPDLVVWSKNGYYEQIGDGSWRWVCGLIVERKVGS